MSLGIKRTRPIRVATKTFEGTLADISSEFESLYGWARRRSLRVGEPDSSGRTSLPWTAVVHSEADMAPEVARRIDLWLPIEGAGASQPGFLVKDMTHDNVAFTIYRGAMAGFDEAVEQLFQWATAKQLPYRGRLHRRIYVRGMDSLPEDPDWEAEIQIPLLSMRN